MLEDMTLKKFDVTDSAGMAIEQGPTDMVEAPRPAAPPANVSIRNFGNYSSNNYGSSRRVSIGELDLYFSYETVIAFSYPGIGLVVSENCWSTTTGKHLNAINPNKKIRKPREQFERMLNETLYRMNLTV